MTKYRIIETVFFNSTALGIEIVDTEEEAKQKVEEYSNESDIYTWYHYEPIEVLI